MSSKKSKQSRSRSKEKSGSNSYGPADDEVMKGGFIPMMIGMTASLMLIFWLASFFTGNASRDKEPAKKRAAEASARLLGSSSFDQFLRDASPDQLVTRLNALKSSTTPKLSPAKVTECDQRVLLCKRLLNTDKSGKFKQFAKLEWLESEKTKYGIDFIGKMKSPKVSEEFEGCFTQFLNDTDQEVYREAHLARVSHVLFECIKGNRTAEKVSEYLGDTLEKFPDDDMVSSTIRLQFQSAVEADIEIAKELAEDIIRKDSLKDVRAAGFMQFVLDNYQILKTNYNQKYINRFANGDVGLRELEKTSLQLLGNPDAGTLVVTAVSQVAGWYEQRRLFESAKTIYQEMVNASQQNRDVDGSKALLEVTGNAGLKRMELIDQEISISGRTMAGKLIEKKDFLGRVIVVMFFNPQDSESIKLLRVVERSARRYAEFGSPVRVVAVPSNAEPFEQSLQDRFPKMRTHFFGWVNGQPPELFNVYPVAKFPHLMAVDHKGNLSRVNLDQKRYETDIDALVDRR